MSTPIYIRKAQIVLALLIIGLLTVFSVCAVADKEKSNRPDDRRDKQSSNRPQERDSKTINVNTGKSYRPDSQKQSDSDHSVSNRPGNIDIRNSAKDYKPSTDKSYRPDPKKQSDSDHSVSYKPGNVNIRNSAKEYKPPTDKSYRPDPKKQSDSDHSVSYRPGNVNIRNSAKDYKPPTDKSYRPDPKKQSDSDHSVSYRPGKVNIRNSAKDYKPPTNKSYRPDSKKQSGFDHSVSYRPGKVIIRNDSRDYKPPTYKSGRYYYSTGKPNRPYRYGHWTFSYHSDSSRKSIYFHYGILPYIQITRIYETPRPVRHYYESTYTTNNTVELNQALEDIRNSWVSGRFDLIERHVRSYSKIAVALDGRYDYSISAEDYLDMTYDTLEETQTVSFVWEQTREYNDGSATAYAKHTYYDSSRSAKVVYISYGLEKSDRNYIITEVDSSLQPLY